MSVDAASRPAGGHSFPSVPSVPSVLIVLIVLMSVPPAGQAAGSSAGATEAGKAVAAAPLRAKTPDARTPARLRTPGSDLRRSRSAGAARSTASRRPAHLKKQRSDRPRPARPADGAPEFAAPPRVPPSVAALAGPAPAPPPRPSPPAVPIGSPGSRTGSVASADADGADGIAQLQALTRTAADRSAAIREAMAAARAAALDTREAEGARLPQLNLDVTSSHTSGGGVDRTSTSRGSPYYAVTGSMPIYDWGRNARVVDSRSASWRAAGARLDGALEALALETTVAALEVARARAGVAAIDVYLGNVQRLVDMLVAITREDPGRSGELTQARSRVLQAQVTRDGLQSRVREAGIALERLAGSAALPVDSVAAAFTDVPSLAALLAELPEQPLLRQLEAEQQAQSNLAESLRSARRPQVGIVASHAPVSPGLAGGYASYAGLTVSVPLYRGGSDVAAQRAAAERASGADERRRQGETDLAARLRTLHQSATALLARDAEFEQLLKESDAVRRGFFDQWYQMGRRSLFELLAVESEHHGLQAARLNTRYDGLVASARLRGEVGSLARWLGLRG